MYNKRVHSLCGEPTLPSEAVDSTLSVLSIADTESAAGGIIDPFKAFDFLTRMHTSSIDHVGE